MVSMEDKRMRAREAGIAIGYLPTGPNNAITDVEGVKVGHRTAWRGDPDGEKPVVRSGVTVVIPHPGDLFRERLYAAV
jgi:D-aminopeptidase